MIRVAIIAASELERAGLAALLSADDEVRVAGSAASLDDAALPNEIDVLLVATGGSGIELTLRGNEIAPVLLVLDDPEPATAAQALRMGALGVVSHQVTGPELAAAVRAVHYGWMVCRPEAMLGIRSAERPVPAMTETLTPRELSVLRMIADGLSNKQIAYKLDISEHTVKFHVNSILHKLGAGSRTEAVTLGLRSGLILL